MERHLELKTETTNKQLGFINDIDLRKVLVERLNELDRVFLVNANYSTVFGALGAVEGILRHVSSIYRDEIKKSSSYPKTGGGENMRFERLTIEELYIELKNLNILPNIPGYEHTFSLFRKYRNCIHPQRQIKEGWEIELGQAQIAIGLLNTTIQSLNQNVFIKKHIFKKIDGEPNYDSNDVLHLKTANTPFNSFIVLNKPISRKVDIKFDLELPQGSLINFVFNYEDEGNFKMVRLDNRGVNAYPNGVLRSSQKYSWKVYLFAKMKEPPEKDLYPVNINIDYDNNVFDFIVDNFDYKFMNKRGIKKDLYDELRTNKRIGFFNEVGSVRLSNIEINID